MKHGMTTRYETNGRLLADADWALLAAFDFALAVIERGGTPARGRPVTEEERIAFLEASSLAP